MKRTMQNWTYAKDMKALSLSVICFCLFFSLAVSASGLSFEVNSELAHAASMVDLSNYTEKPHVIYDSVSSLIEQIKSVEEEPCSLAFCRNLLAPVSTHVGLERVMATEDTSEEGCAQAAIITRPLLDSDGFHRVVRYLSNEDNSPGSIAFATALKFRRKSRIVKLDSYCIKQTGRSLFELSEEDFLALSLDEVFEWLVQDVFEPVPILVHPVFKRRFGKIEQAPGPSFFRHTVLNMVSEEGNPSEICFDSAMPLISRYDSCIFAGDIPGVLSVEEAIDDDSLGNILGHECFHGIMFDMMGPSMPGKKFSQSTVGHDTHIVSDYSLAISEGWAEMFEALTGKDNPAFDESEDMVRFLVGRQDAVRYNKYIQSGYEKFESTKKTGLIKNGNQLISNEGFGAAILYRIMTHRVLDKSFELAVKAMYMESPSNMCELIAAMAQLAPDKRTHDVILKVFLFGSKFSTVSSEARRLYQEYYIARLAYLNGKNDRLPSEQIEELSVLSREASDSYHQFVKTLMPSILSGELALDSAIGPELWLKVTRGGRESRNNMNTATVVELVSLGLSRDGAVRIISIRDSLGYISSIEDLRTLNAGDLELIKSLLVS